MAWSAIRFPALALVVILEPLIRVLLAGSALLLVLAVGLLELVSPRPVPVWGMLGLAILCVGLLGAYYALLRILSL